MAQGGRFQGSQLRFGPGVLADLLRHKALTGWTLLAALLATGPSVFMLLGPGTGYGSHERSSLKVTRVLLESYFSGGRWIHRGDLGLQASPRAAAVRKGASRKLLSLFVSAWPVAADESEARWCSKAEVECSVAAVWKRRIAPWPNWRRSYWIRRASSIQSGPVGLDAAIPCMNHLKKPSLRSREGLSQQKVRRESP